MRGGKKEQAMLIGGGGPCQYGMARPRVADETAYRCGGWLTIYWTNNHGQPTMGNHLSWGLRGPLTTPHSIKLVGYEISSRASGLSEHIVRMWNIKGIENLVWKTLGNKSFWRLGININIILKWTLNKYDAMMWIKFFELTIVSTVQKRKVLVLRNSRLLKRVSASLS
jgi:hypothetical protein